MNTNTPSELRLMNVFLQRPLGMNLCATQFSCIKDGFQFEPTSTAAIGGAPHSLSMPGALCPIGSHHWWGETQAQVPFFVSVCLMGNPNNLASPRVSASWSLSCYLSPVTVLSLSPREESSKSFIGQTANYGMRCHPLSLKRWFSRTLSITWLKI